MKTCNSPERAFARAVCCLRAARAAISMMVLAACAVPVSAVRAQSNSCTNPTPISGIGAFPFTTAGATTSYPNGPQGDCFPPGQSQAGNGPATIQNDVWFLWTNDTCTDFNIDYFTCAGPSDQLMIATYQGKTTCPTQSDQARCCHDAVFGNPVCAAGSPRSHVNCETQCCDAVLIQVGTKPGSPPVSGTLTITCNNPSGCGRPQGCCLPDGTCKELPGLCCDNLGGTALGLGVHCEGDADGDGNDDACCDAVPDNAVVVELNTGRNDANGSLIPLAGNDDTWRVACAPSPTLGPIPRQAQVVPQNFAWCAPFNNSQWIGYSPIPNAGFPAGDYCYWSCFCLNPLFENVELQFSLRADNGADVYLHNMGPAVSHHLTTAPISSFSCPTVTNYFTLDENLFAPGENCLEVRVHNLGGATGFDLSGKLIAENARCCCEALPDGSGCSDTTCANVDITCKPVEQVVNPGTGQIVVTKCACVPPNICPEPCDDGRVCNGLEQCLEGKQCVSGDEPCPPGSLCRESMGQCLMRTQGMVGNFADCMNGPDMGVATGCGVFDLDDEGDCDLSDYGQLQRAFELP